MPVYKSKVPTKDGRCWFHKTQFFKPGDTEEQVYVSKKYATRTEALMAEQTYLLEIAKSEDTKPVDMTFEELIERFLEFKKAEVRFSTYQGYFNMLRYLKCFYPIKCSNYNIMQYEAWKKDMNKKNLSTRTKNDILKFWKSILNYGMNWFNHDYVSIYRRMSNFTNPNELKKEMKYYTFEEFKKFISFEDNIKFKCLWETLYYCGLRCGEARGLTWNCIDFDKKILTINKQVINPPIGSGLHYYVTNPKTKTSNRRIPICDLLLNDLALLKEEYYASDPYNGEHYVFGNFDKPFSPGTVYEQRNKIANTANLKVIRLHDFRHSCASLLINSGGNVTLVAKYLGHSEIEETLNTYSHMFPSALDSVIGIINELEN